MMKKTVSILVTVLLFVNVFNIKAFADNDINIVLEYIYDNIYSNLKTNHVEKFGFELKGYYSYRSTKEFIDFSDYNTLKYIENDVLSSIQADILIETISFYNPYSSMLLTMGISDIVKIFPQSSFNGRSIKILNNIEYSADDEQMNNNNDLIYLLEEQNRMIMCLIVLVGAIFGCWIVQSFKG